MVANFKTITLSIISTWPTANYVNPPERTWMPIFGGILQGITTLMVGTRLVLRFRSQAGSLGLDDVLLIPGFLLATAFAGLAIAAQKFGNGRHIWDVEPDDAPTAMMIAFLSEIVFVASTCFTKVSVLMFYRRLTDASVSKKWKWSAIAATIFTCAYSLTCILTLVFACSPTDAYWKAVNPFYAKPYHCANITALNPISGSLSIFSDAYAILLPMGMMRNFELTKQRKLALNAVFSLGLIVVITGIVRTYYLSQLGTAVDLTWIGYNVFVWSLLEAQLAIICACAPSLRVFLRQYLGKPISRIIRTHQSESGGSRAQRNSMPLEHKTWASPAFTSPNQDHFPNDKGPLITEFSSKSSNYLVEERDLESRGSSESGVRTSAELSSFALRNLEAHRVHAR